MNFISKKKLFFLIAIFSCIALGSSVVNSSPTSLNTSDQSIYPRTAATSNYKLDLNITWGGSEFEAGYGIALDESENIYIAAYTESFGMGIYDTLVAKFDKTGSLKMNLNWGGSLTEWASDIALDDSGNIYITGAVGSDAFIVKYDSFGLLEWGTIWGGSLQDTGRSIALNGSDIFITGDTNSFGAGGTDAFTVKFNSTGHLKMNITWGDNWADFGYDIAINGSDIFICGANSSMTDTDAFIAKFDSKGVSKMNITWVGSYYDSANGIALDDSGNIYVTGTTDCDGSGDHSNPFIAKFNSTGDSTMNITWGSDPTKDDYANSIALDNSGNIYIAGKTQSFGSGILDNAFIAKYDSKGHSKTNITWGGDYIDYANSIALDSSGSIYITGKTESHGAGNDDAFILKYTPIAAVGYYALVDEDDDDDDDESVNVRLIAIIILASIGACVAVIYILIKKGIISSSKSKR